jgi:hypothetical protein
MADGSVEDVHKQNAEAINIHYDLVDVLKYFLPDGFTIYMWEGQLAINHYDCDTGIEQLGKEVPLHEMAKIARDHLVECENRG